MKRRSILGMIAAAPSLAVSIADASSYGPRERKIGGRRLSCRKDDSGYLEYGLAIGAGKNIKIYLNGKEQKYAITADESEGMVCRFVTTDGENFAHDGENVLEETVYGDVTIVLS